MPFLPNSTPATAVPITFPWTITVEQADIDPSTDGIYYSFTAGPTDTLLGITVAAARNSSGVGIIEANGTTHALGNLFANHVGAAQQALTPGNHYYLLVWSGTVPDTVTVNAFLHPYHVVVPAGAVLVNDDACGWPALVFGLDGTFYRAPVCCAGEMGDVLPTGEFLMGAVGDDTYQPRPIEEGQIYDKHFNLIASVRPFPEHPVNAFSISMDFAETFYVVWPQGALGSGHPIVRTVSKAGVVGPTTWTLPGTQSGYSAVSPGGGILYYGQFTSPSAVKRFDLVGNVALSDLVATPSGFNVTDIVCLADGTILVSFLSQIGYPQAQVRHFAPDGTLLHTYANTTVYQTDHICRNGNSVTDFIWWNESNGGDTGIYHSTFSRIRISDGAVLETVTTPFSEQGRLKGTDVPWAPSGSCPFLVLTQPGGCPPALEVSECWNPHSMDALQVRLNGEGQP